MVAFALLGMLALPAVASAVSFTVTWPALPAGWSPQPIMDIKQNPGSGHRFYGTSVGRSIQTDTGQTSALDGSRILQSGGAQVSVQEYDGKLYPDIESVRTEYAEMRVHTMEGWQASGQDQVVPELGRPLTAADFGVDEVSETQFQGKPAFKVESSGYVIESKLSDVPYGPKSRTWTVTYIVNLDSSFVMITASAGEDLPTNDFDALKAETEQVLGGLRIDWGGSESTPWRTVAAGFAAVLAAATALAAAFANSARGRANKDPRAVVGYVLQLSSAELRLAPSRPVPFSADAWRVHADGTLAPAHDVTVTITPPAGVGVDPTSGPGGVRGTVWQTADLDGAADLIVTAAGARGGTQAAVHLVPDETLQLSFEFPAGASPNVFTEGWVFGAKAVADPGTANERDISDTVEWSGTGSFDPPVGAVSRPHFHAEGENTIMLKVEGGGKVVTRSLIVSAISPELFCAVGSVAICTADSHGCGACPHQVTGVVRSGSPTVTVRGAPAARQGDGGTHQACCGSNTFVISGGDQRVLIDGRPAAHMLDATQHCGGVGKLVS